MAKALSQCPAPPFRLVGADGSEFGSDWQVTNLMDITANDSDKSWVVPAAEEWQIMWVEVHLTTTATAGVRQLEMQMNRPGAAMPGPEGTWARAGSTQDPSTTHYYIFAPGLADLTAWRDTDFLTTPIPVTSLLRGGDELRVFDNNAVDPAADDMEIWVQYAKRTVSFA